jgi:hypothetical protein
MDATVRRIGAIAEQEVGEKCRLDLSFVAISNIVYTV